MAKKVWRQADNVIKYYHMRSLERAKTNTDYEDNYRLGLEYQEQGKIIDAMDAYHRAINERGTQPARYGVHFNLANCFRYQAYLGNTAFLEPAEYQYQRALSLAEANPLAQAQILLERSDLYVFEGREAKAQDDLSLSLQKLKSSAVTPVNLAMRELVFLETIDSMGRIDSGRGRAAGLAVEDTAEVILLPELKPA
jgi:tetratricopeptide (TPR) repeat protein